MSAWSRIIISPSKTLATVLAAFCVGILFGPFGSSISFSVFAFMIFFTMFAIVWCWADRSRRTATLIVLVALLGLARYTAVINLARTTTVADVTGTSVRVDGTIVQDVEERLDHQRVILTDLAVREKPVDGKLLVRLPLYPRVHLSDRLVFTCALERPEPIEGFRYDRYLESQGVFAVCSRPGYVDIHPAERWSFARGLFVFKHALTDRLSQIVPEPHASFLAGLLFGGSSGLSSALREDFSKTGTSHILAASGFNLSLFTILFFGWIVETPLGRRRGVFVTFILVWFYAILALATAPVVRAAVMATVVLMSRWARRRAWTPTLLLIPLALMLAWNPRLLLDDVGFQLSFVALISLISLAPRLVSWFLWIPQTFQMRTTIVSTLAASFSTAPILLWHFGSLSILSPFVNTLVLPLVPLAMGSAALGILASYIFVPIGTFLSLPAFLSSSWTLHVIHWFASIPFVSFSVSAQHTLAIVLSVLVVGVWISLIRREPTEL